MHLSDSTWASIAVIVCVIGVLLLGHNISNYYKYKADKMTEMIKNGGDPIEIGCVFYQSCSDGVIILQAIKNKEKGGE